MEPLRRISFVLADEAVELDPMTFTTPELLRREGDISEAITALMDWRKFSRSIVDAVLSDRAERVAREFRPAKKEVAK